MVILGIDLGTSSSAAAVLLDGRVQIIPNPDTGTTGKPFPSVVSFFRDGSCLIGAPAEEQRPYNPHGTISNIKRDMGTTRQIEVFGKSFIPQFISALLLMKIRLDTESFLNEKITQAVITIPANFNDAQRQATLDAGRIAGLDVVRLLQEPVAAAMSYGLHHLEEPSKILVFDMGAGTLDVSILEVDSGFFEVISTSGSQHVGGIGMDDAVSEWLAEEHERQHGQKPDAAQSLRRLSELATMLKHELSERDEASFDEDIPMASHLAGKITRGVFEKLIGGLLDECRDVIMQALDNAGLHAADIDRVVLVGGPSKVPSVRRLLRTAVREPEDGIDPYFAVVSGAAIQGGVLANDKNLPELYNGLTLLEVTPLDLAEEARKDGKIVPVVMIPKNTPYPTFHTETFYVNKPLQTEVEIRVWQGDFETNPGFAGSVSLGAFVLSGLRAGCQNEVEVRYELNDNGILTVRAAEIGGGVKGELTIDRIWSRMGAVAELGYEQPDEHAGNEEEMKSYESKYRDVMSPYETPIGNQQEEVGDAGMSWMCDSLADAKGIIRTHHADLPADFFDTARFELFLQDDMQYAYAYIHLSGGPVYQIGIHKMFAEHTRETQRSLIVTLVHELLHAVHPDWGHNRIRPEERRLANLAHYFDAYVEHERMFLSGRMSFCNNTHTSVDGKRISCG